jgi:hypothetical protein
MHLDLLVDDLDAAEAKVSELGATKHPDQPGTSFRVAWTQRATPSVFA